MSHQGWDLSASPESSTRARYLRRITAHIATPAGSQTPLRWSCVRHLRKHRCEVRREIDLLRAVDEKIRTAEVLILGVDALGDDHAHARRLSCAKADVRVLQNDA